MSTKFLLNNKFPGYVNKTDITKVLPGQLVAGSQNVLTNNGEKVYLRKGYILDGQANSAAHGITASYDWYNASGEERNLRAYYDNLEFRNVAADGTITWQPLITGLAGLVNFNFAEWWNGTEDISELLMVNGTTSVWEWSGAIATFASADNSTGWVESLGSLVQNSILTVDIGSAGTGYVAGDVVNVVGGTGTAGKLNVVTVDGGGGATSISVNFGGQSYSVTLGSLNTSGGHGTGLQINILSVETGGHGYQLGDVVTIAGGSATIMIDTVVISGGHVSTFFLFDSASGYTTGLHATTGGSGTGFIVNIVSVTSNTITKQGTTSFVEEDFYTSTSGKSVTINGIVYTYVGMLNNQLFGISPDPVAAGIAVGTLIIQTPIENKNTPFNSIDMNGWTNDIIASLDNAIFLGSFYFRIVWVSKDDFFNSQDTQFILDANPTAFIPQEESMYITGGNSKIWQTYYQTLALGDTSVQQLQLKAVKSGLQGAPLSQAMITNDKNDVIFVSHEPALTTLGRVINILGTPNTLDISDPIKVDMLSYDFTGAALKYFQRFYFLTIPTKGVYRMYNIVNQWWEAPQTGTFSRFSIINGQLYAHDSTKPQTYKLNTGLNDNGEIINGIAMFAYDQNGDRADTKDFNEFYVEGYISTDTSIDVLLNYDYKAAGGSYPTSISGVSPPIT